MDSSKPRQETFSVKETEDRLRTDIRWLIESTFSILDKDSKLSPLVFNEVQKYYWPKITPRDIILKSRKMGFTTIRLARMVAKCATQNNRRAIVVSHEDEATKRILGRASEMCSTCLIDLSAKITEDTIRFKNTKSTLYIGTAGSKAFGRGDDITDYLLTEFAWWAKPDIITGIEEGCVKNSEGCIESTAHGYGNPFHSLWLRAQRKEHGMILPDGAPRSYTAHFFPWFQDSTLEVDCTTPLQYHDEYERMLITEFNVSDRKLLWRRLKIESMFDPLLVQQEYPATSEEAFLVSGSMVFNAMALAKHELNARPLLWKGEIKDYGDHVGMEPGDRGRFNVWITPKPGHNYIITADVASGIPDGCYSVADVFDLATNEQVAQWRGHIAPDSFGDSLCLMGAYYNYATIWPEVNNHGLTTCSRIRDNQYPNLGHRDNNRGGTDLGFYTSPGKSGTRIEVINSAREAIRDFSIKINSPQTISECRTYITAENDTMESMPGCWSDCIITLGIGGVMMKRFTSDPSEQRDSFGGRVGRMNPGSRLSIPSYRGGYR